MLAEVCPELAAERLRTACDAQSFRCLRHVVALRGETPAGAISWQEMLDRGRTCDVDLEAIGRTLSPHEPINIQYTSGTTGFPKAATLSHRNLLLNAYYVGACQKMSEQDRICIPVPFYHCFGCVLGTLCARFTARPWSFRPTRSIPRPRSTPSSTTGPR